MKRDTKKLWRVKVEYQVVVLAKDRKEAKSEVLLGAAQHELINHHNIIRVTDEIRNTNNVPNGWLDRIPYGSYLSRLLEGKTVREILTRKLFKPFRREKQHEMSEM